jgi:signal transduction histidine kinase
MPALAKPPVVLPRFVPHGNNGASAGAGSFSHPKPKSESIPTPNSRPTSETIDGLAHDARNILSGLMLYCELLASPGVLATPHSHYAKDLEGIAKNASRLLEKILEKILDRAAAPQNRSTVDELALPALPAIPLPALLVTDATAELRHLQPLLAAIAGPTIRLSIATMPCAGPTMLAVEDLTRILVNLIRNAADAMLAGGHIRITTQYGDGLGFLESAQAASFGPPRGVILTVADDGPGIPEALRELIFDLGFTTHKQKCDWPAPRRRGLGLSIVRNLVEAAGGTIRAVPNQPRGARFDITLPFRDSVTSGTCSVPPDSAFPADPTPKGCIECQ